MENHYREGEARKPPPPDENHALKKCSSPLLPLSLSFSSHAIIEIHNLLRVLRKSKEIFSHA
jgi:hypothetical protein